MILRERIIRYMWKQGKPISGHQIKQHFSENHHSTAGALDRLRNIGHIQPVGNQVCAISGKKVPHYTLTKKALDSIFQRKGGERYGKFIIKRDNAGYEYLTANPIKTYIDPKYIKAVKVYPAGYALGIAPQGNTGVRV